MTGLTEEQQEQRARNIANASELHRIMPGYDDPEPKPPNRDIENYDAIYKYLEPLYLDGMRSTKDKPLLVGNMTQALGFKVSAKDQRDPILAAIKFDQPAEPSEPVVTYAHERVQKMLFRDDEYDLVDTYAMRIGREREPEAMKELAKATGLVFEHTGDDQKNKARNGLGATPDGLYYDSRDLVAAGAEVKSFAPKHHLDCILCTDQAKLRKYEFDVFCQCQAGMYVHEVGTWFAGFYNPWAKKEPLLKFNFVEVAPDELFIRKMEEKIRMVKTFMDARLKELETALECKLT